MSLKVIIEGNDGTGKSTLCARLIERGYNVQDRGILTKMTDDDTLAPIEGEYYLILDVPVDISRKRLEAAGKDLTEQYHTVEDLTHYRRRYQEIAEVLDPRCHAVIDASGSVDETFYRALTALEAFEALKQIT